MCLFRRGVGRNAENYPLRAGVILPVTQCLSSKSSNQCRAVSRPFKQLNAEYAEFAENRFQLRVLRALRVERLFQRLSSGRPKAAPRWGMSPVRPITSHQAVCALV